MPTDHKRFDRIFNPKTVVVVGAKKATNYSWLRNMLTVKGKAVLGAVGRERDSGDRGPRRH